MKMSSYPILIRISFIASFEADWAFAEAAKAIENMAIEDNTPFG